jgi:hypothetical protein
MNANTPFEDDEIPDLSTPEWRDQFDSAKVRRGRPPAELTKVSTTIRLDAGQRGAPNDHG